MSLATIADANRWLDGTKVRFVDLADGAEEAAAADAFVLGRLYDAYPEIALTWDADPTDPQVATPSIVRLAVGLLMASFRYARKYSEQTTKTSNYAKELEMRAMGILDKITQGDILLYDVETGVPTGVAIDIADFWPNDNSAIYEPKDGPHVTMRMVF